MTVFWVTKAPVLPAALGLGLTLGLLHIPVLPSVAWAWRALIAGIVFALLVGARAGTSEGLAPFLLCLVLPPLLALVHAAKWNERLLPEECERQPLMLQGTILGLPKTLLAPPPPVSGVPGISSTAKSSVVPRSRSWRHGRALHRIDLRIDSLSPERCAGPRRVRLYVPEKRGAELGTGTRPELRGFSSGQRVALQALLRRPWGQVNPAALDGERAYLVQGIHAVGTGSVLGFPERSEGLSAHARIDRYRAATSAWLRSRYPGTAGVLLAALGVGDSRFLDSENWDRLRRFGVTHLMVISGMHISLVALIGWCVGLLLSRSRRTYGWYSRVCAPGMAVSFAVTYALLAGLSLPTLRALLMLVLALLPRVLGRPGDSMRALALSVWLLICFDPLAVLGASFWLSAGAVLLLIWCAGWSGPSRPIASMLRVQAFMALAMTPLSLFWFGEASVLGFAANLVAIPAVSVVIVPTLLLALVVRHIEPAWGAHLLSVPGATLETGWELMARVQGLGHDLSMIQRPLGTEMALVGTLAALLLALPPWPGRRRTLSLLLAALLLPGRPPEARGLEITVYDVGQGTAILVRTQEASLLYDTGPGPPNGPAIAERTVLPHLRRLELAHLNYLVLSHSDLDHVAGEGAVRRTLSVQQTFRGGVAVRRDEPCRLGQRFALGTDVQLRVLAGVGGADSENNGSCVLSLRYAGREVLLPGDIDQDRERAVLAYWGERLRADLLHAAHHGSASSSSRLWLRSLAPEHLIISAGRANRFGHPAPPVLMRARERGVAVLNTASSGALLYRIEADGRLSCRRLRHRRAPFWRWSPLDQNCSP